MKSLLNFTCVFPSGYYIHGVVWGVSPSMKKMSRGVTYCHPLQFFDGIGSVACNMPFNVTTLAIVDIYIIYIAFQWCGIDAIRLDLVHFILFRALKLVLQWN